MRMSISTPLCIALFTSILYSGCKPRYKDSEPPKPATVLFLCDTTHLDESQFEPLGEKFSIKGYDLVNFNYSPEDYAKRYPGAMMTGLLAAIDSIKMNILAKDSSCNLFILSAGRSGAAADIYINNHPEHVMGAASLFGNSFSVPDGKVPALYIYGSTDTITDTKARKLELSQSPHFGKEITCLEYKDVGHGFTDAANERDAINRIDKFFRMRQDFSTVQ